MRLFSGRPALLAMAAVVMLGVGGCYEVAFFYPSPTFGGGRGSLLTDGRGMGVVARLTGKKADGAEGQAYVVLSVGEAYTARAEGGDMQTILKVVANVVNETNKPVRLNVKDTRLEVQGRVFGAKWTYREPEAEEGAAETVEGGLTARYDMYFDLGVWTPASSGWVAGTAPWAGGIPLGTIREITVSWKALFGAEGDVEKRSGKARFVRDGPWAYPVTAGPYWGGGWYMWADPYGWPSLWPSLWPTGGLIFGTHWGFGSEGAVFKK